MSQIFDYEPRSKCICGVSLKEARARVDKVYTWGEISFLRCSHCGSWCQSPMVAAAALSRWIDSEEYRGSEHCEGVAYTNYLADESNRLLEARERCRRDINSLLPARARVLEVGCATGSLLAVLRESGHEVMGVDLSRSFVNVARSHYGLNVSHGDILDVPLEAGSFDAVLAMGTIGNFRELERCLAYFRELLRPGGILVFNYPDADSLWVRLIYRSRFWMFTPSVCTFMTTRGCRAVIRHAGFRESTIRSDIQRPSLRKLLHHGRADFLLAFLKTIGLDRAAVPFPFAVPTIRFAIARS